ncbi:hypothetical protein C0Q70_10197 [Pomacea canaliculata]|uniref:Uncharacterized protein n=1 Tax=Pomacea canaliculata TaxID=400727 RepID=A0A2T7PBY8_POMCA|nr:hypothetical protein C0Q70_10197 [Pomacea canaliculata]
MAKVCEYFSPAPWPVPDTTASMTDKHQQVRNLGVEVVKRHYQKKTLLTPRETASCFPVFFTRRRSAGGRLASHLHKKRSNDVTDQRRESKHALLPQSSPGARGLPLQPLLAPGVRGQNSFPCG